MRRSELLFQAPLERPLAYVGFYRGEFGSAWVLTQDGGLFKTDFDQKQHHFTLPAEKFKLNFNYGLGEYGKQVMGDDIYVVSSLAVYVSRDDGKTFNYDTTGLNGAVVTQIALDSSFNVFAATSRGLYKQLAKDNNWVKLNTGSSSGFVTINVNNDDVINASDYSLLYKSVDRGKTFTVDTNGIGRGNALKFAQDSAGNSYVILTNYGQSNFLFKQPKGSSKWTQIGQQVSKMAVDSSNSPVFNDIVPGGKVYLATTFGLFFSSDQGNTWVQSNSGIRAGYVFDLLKQPSGKSFISTALGIYSGKFGDSAAAWTKVFPTQGFIKNRPIFMDKSGALYTLGKQNSGYNGYLFQNMKSLDNGTTWVPDTLGNSSLSNGIYFADENGRQYVATYGSTKLPVLIYSKTTGNNWVAEKVLDSIPFNAYQQPSIFGSDRKGSVFLSIGNNGNGINLKRNANGT